MSKRCFILVAGLAFFLTANGAAFAQTAEPSQERTPVNQRDLLLNQGFELLKKGDRVNALTQFKAARAVDPNYPLTIKQIAYLEFEDDDLKASAASFEEARVITPTDYSLALQLGYVYDRLGKEAQAEKEFRDALNSAVPQIHLNASNALKTVLRDRRAWYFDLYGSPLYTSRFHNGIATVQGRLGWKPSADVPVSLYLGGQVTRDTNSKGGTLPIIFSDNVGLVGVGIQVQPRHSHFTLRTEANLAVPLISGGGYNYAARGDFRAIASYYNRFDGRLWGPVGLLTLGHARNDRLFNDLDVSAGFYSRYNQNGIAYLQGREGLQLGSIGRSQFFGYLKYDIAKDTHHDFYNNLAEGGPGIEFRPDRRINMGLRFEYLRGSYFGIAREPNPYRPNYNDFRVTLVFGDRF